MLISLHKSTIRFSGTRAAEGVKRRQRGDKYNIDFDSFCCQAGVCVRARTANGGAGVWGRKLQERKPSRAGPAPPSTLQKVTRPGLLIFTKHQRPGAEGKYPVASEGFLGAKNNTRLSLLESELCAAWSSRAKPSSARFSSSVLRQVLPSRC